MPDPVPAEEKSRWFQELCAAQEEIAAARCQAAVGTVQRVLVEEEGKREGMLAGRTRRECHRGFSRPGVVDWKLCARENHAGTQLDFDRRMAFR